MNACFLLHLACVLVLPAECESVPLCRVFGSKFAEMPFVATKEGYRREGNCKRLLRVSSVFAPDM